LDDLSAGCLRLFRPKRIQFDAIPRYITAASDCSKGHTVTDAWVERRTMSCRKLEKSPNTRCLSERQRKEAELYLALDPHGGTSSVK
jgi:hypothetical protein